MVRQWADGTQGHRDDRMDRLHKDLHGVAGHSKPARSSSSFCQSYGYYMEHLSIKLPTQKHKETVAVSPSSRPNLQMEPVYNKIYRELKVERMSAMLGSE